MHSTANIHNATDLSPLNCSVNLTTRSPQGILVDGQGGSLETSRGSGGQDPGDGGPAGAPRPGAGPPRGPGIRRLVQVLKPPWNALLGTPGAGGRSVRTVESRFLSLPGTVPSSFTPSATRSQLSGPSPSLAGGDRRTWPSRCPRATSRLEAPAWGVWGPRPPELRVRAYQFTVAAETDCHTPWLKATHLFSCSSGG